jgi:hypothetical protein
MTHLTINDLFHFTAPKRRFLVSDTTGMTGDTLSHTTPQRANEGIEDA